MSHFQNVIVICGESPYSTRKAGTCTLFEYPSGISSDETKAFALEYSLNEFVFIPCGSQLFSNKCHSNVEFNSSKRERGVEREGEREKRLRRSSSSHEWIDDPEFLSIASANLIKTYHNIKTDVYVHSSDGDVCLQCARIMYIIERLCYGLLSSLHIAQSVRTKTFNRIASAIKLSTNMRARWLNMWCPPATSVIFILSLLRQQCGLSRLQLTNKKNRREKNK